MRSGSRLSASTWTSRSGRTGSGRSCSRSLRVLRKFPLRAGLNKLDVLDRLLWIALSYGDRSRVLELVDAKLARQSMEVAQQVRWLAAGLVAASQQYTEHLDEYVSAHDRRVRALAAFFGASGAAVRLPSPSYEGSAPALGTLIALMGRSFAPAEPTEWGAIEAAAEKVDRLIRRLSSMPEGRRRAGIGGTAGRSCSCALAPQTRASS